MDINLLIGGAAGQGINTIEDIILKALKLSGYHVFASKEIMSRIRGGINTTTIRISDESRNGFKRDIDILIPLNEYVSQWVKNRINENTLIFDNSSLKYEETAKEAGGKIFENIVIAGVISGIFKVDFEIVANIVKKTFEKKSEDIIKKNISALKKGYEKGISIKNFNINKKSISKKALINGAQGVALGALAGGCNFLSFYPMSPATSVAIFLTTYAKETDIVVEQFEDEIAAACASIGAWYAGARGFITTSGGGFALMEEAISLAGMAENPLVLHLAQRPGPATGLPTRTIQSDLNLVLNAGHGEFPRVIFTPSTIEDTFYLTQKSFNLADKYQVPVFILTDQFLVDSYYTTDKIDFNKIDNEYFIGITDKSYRRYELTPNGISIRGIPGFGNGIVLANGNEHDEWGDISENEYINKIMPDKRMKKLEKLKEDAITPYFSGNPDYKTLVVSWGSTFYTIKEALKLLKNDSFAHVHFSQVWPLNDKIGEYFEKAEKIIVIEENVTGQFADLIKRKFCLNNIEKFLKYNGRHFYVEEIYEHFSH
jgi:2-oxoglutarate ferredoxin oxidoreductase subunit alpha